VLDGSGQPITLDTQATIDPQDTSEVQFTGNLPAEVNGPLAEVLESGAPFNSGTPASLAGSAAGPFAVPDGETWTMRIAMDGKASQEIAVTSVGGTITAQQIADEINLELGAGTATVNGAGQLEITSSKVGKASTVLVIPGGAGQDLAGVAGLGTNLVTGTQQLAEGTTDLNDLVSNDADYQVGDLIRLSGTNAAGDPVESTFTYGTDGTTLDDLAAFVDSMYTDASASFDAATGKLQLEADASGEANLSLVVLDEDGQAGGTNWANTAFGVSTDGTGPDTVTSSIQVYDTLGVPHLVSFEFERLDDGSWGLSAELPDEDGTVFNGQLSGIVFDSDGKLPGQLTLDLQVQFGEQPPTDISLKLGGDDEFAGITQFGGATTLLAADQDGYPPGELASVTVDGLGDIIGIYSNGQDRVLGDVGVATFANDRGLLSEGDSYFRASSASGQASLGAISGAGEIVAGALESANVDTSQEFVQLIEAQRGYQANARVISIQDRMLEEGLNIL
jgi:flagellar hook protein FlgE